MKTVELKNIVHLVAKKIWSSVNPVYKNMSQVHKITLEQITLRNLFEGNFAN